MTSYKVGSWVMLKGSWSPKVHAEIIGVRKQRKTNE